MSAHDECGEQDTEHNDSDVGLQDEVRNPQEPIARVSRGNAQAGVSGVVFAKAKTSRRTQRTRRCEAKQSLIAQAERKRKPV